MKIELMEIKIMKLIGRIIISLLFMLMFISSGCSEGQRSLKIIPGSGSGSSQHDDMVAKRFQDSTPQGTTAIESAMELSERYARLSEEAAKLRQQNQEYASNNQELDDRISDLESQLEQAQKELTEANDLLIEMRVELNNWKTDILGFREEIRDAETAQLEALMKILRVLGGDVQQASAENSQSDSVVASLNASN